jgi:hypothetical protein
MQIFGTDWLRVFSKVILKASDWDAEIRVLFDIWRLSSSHGGGISVQAIATYYLSEQPH